MSDYVSLLPASTAINDTTTVDSDTDNYHISSPTPPQSPASAIKHHTTTVHNNGQQPLLPSGGVEPILVYDTIDSSNALDRITPRKHSRRHAQSNNVSPIRVKRSGAPATSFTPQQALRSRADVSGKHSVHSNDNTASTGDADNTANVDSAGIAVLVSPISQQYVVAQPPPSTRHRAKPATTANNTDSTETAARVSLPPRQMAIDNASAPMTAPTAISPINNVHAEWVDEECTLLTIHNEEQVAEHSDYNLKQTSQEHMQSEVALSSSIHHLADHVSTRPRSTSDHGAEHSISVNGTAHAVLVQPLTRHSRSQSQEHITNMSFRHSHTLSTEQRKIRRRLLEAGVLRFNSHAAQGLEYLGRHHIIDANNPDSVATFLLTTGGLSKTQIGDFLGDSHAFNISVMYAYVNKLDFSGMTFDQALRYFLSGFRLPGEAQMIDRLVEKFAERVCRTNPDLFSDQDSAYLLAYACIMLNVDAHSDKVKHKMSCQAFLRNCRDLIRQGLSKQYLSMCYYNIVSREIKTNMSYLEMLYQRVKVSDNNVNRLARRM